LGTLAAAFGRLDTIGLLHIPLVCGRQKRFGRYLNNDPIEVETAADNENLLSPVCRFIAVRYAVVAQYF
jgi:hypothetical protein